MKLQLDSIDIRDIEIGSRTMASDHMLYLDLRELEELLLKDDRIKSVELNVVRPGDRVRIVNVVDVIQPRCKTDQRNEDFPGWLGKLAIAGRGRTRSLRGITIVLSNRHSKRLYSGLIDMFGIGAEMSSYGGMRHLLIDPTPLEGTDERDFESAVKIAGLKTAVFLARAAREHPVDHTEFYELDLPTLLAGEKSTLPRIAYYYQLHSPQHDYQGLPDPIFYGAPVPNLLPTLIHPNEVLDGGIVNSHTIRGMDTYTIQNHAVIKELFERHGKELIFTGVVIGAACLEPIQRQRMSIMAANLVSHVLGADGVILTKVHGGMPHVDLGLVAEACEDLGVKTTLFAQVWSSSGSLSDYVLFSSNSLDAIVSVGNNLERVQLPQANTILGGTPETRMYNPDRSQTAGDEAIETEIFLLAGAFDYLGGSKIVADEY